MNRTGGFTRWVGAIISLLLFSLQSWAGERAYTVVCVQNESPHINWETERRQGLESGLAEYGLEANVYYEYLNVANFYFEQELFIARRICQRARENNVDAIVAVGDESLSALLKCGDSIVYKLPLVFCDVHHPDYSILDNMQNVCGIVSRTNYEGLIDKAAQMFPDRKDIICVTGWGLLAEEQFRDADTQIKQYLQTHEGYSYKSINLQDNLDEVLRAVLLEDKKDHRILIFPKWQKVLNYICSVSHAPVFSTQSKSITKKGSICVQDLLPGKEMKMAGARLGKVLNGTNPSVLGIVNKPDNEYVLEFSRLKEFGFQYDEAKGLGNLMHVTFHDKYLWAFYIIHFGSVFLLGVASLYIIIYIHHRRSRKNQERDLYVKQIFQNKSIYKDVINSSERAVIIYDINNNIMFVNRKMLGLVKMKEDRQKDLVGKPLGSIFYLYHDGENIQTQLIQQVYETEQKIMLPSNSFLVSSVTKEYIPIEGGMNPVVINGELKGIFFHCEKISIETIKNKAFLDMERGSIYTWSFDMNEQKFYFADELLQKFGYEKGRVFTAGEFRLLIDPETREETIKKFYRIIEERRVSEPIRLHIRDSRGNMQWWEVLCTSLSGPMKDKIYLVVGICQNIQANIDRENALEKARDEAHRANLIKTAFLQNINHEIRTPLNAIDGFSSILRDYENYSKKDVNEFIDIIESNSKHLLDLMNDVLVLSRIEAGNFDVHYIAISLTKLFEEIYDVEDKKPRSGDVEMILSCPAEELVVTTDGERLKMAISVLIDNARKYTKSGTITYGYESLGEGHYRCFVKDTGFGISAKNLPHIFDRFYKVDSFVRGTGLGLPICKVITEKMGGRVEVHSELGAGSTFELIF